MTGVEYNHINDVMQDLYQDGKLSEGDFDCICNIIDKADRYDKYKWHNLRKNPEDLPTEEGSVLVSLNGEYRPEGRNYGTTFIHAVDMIYWVNDGKFYAGPEEWMNEFVEAWKYPDQFTEVKE